MEKGKKFIISLLLISVFLLNTQESFARNYANYSNTRINFGLSLRRDHKRPACAKPAKMKFSNYNAYYCDSKAYKKKKKVIYLTFDCGYEGGYTKKVLKILKKNNIKAIFFVTEAYIKQAPNLVKKMKKDGHLVGNHTCNHPRLTECSVKRIKNEIKQCAKTMKKLTGYKMDKYVRPPEGVYSKRVLKVLQDMGYATMFWSLAYYDYDPAHQPGKNTVITKFKNHYFPGMMPLIHIVSKSNKEALPSIINFFEKKKYKFGQVSDFVKGKTTISSNTSDNASNSTYNNDEAAINSNYNNS